MQNFTSLINENVNSREVKLYKQLGTKFVSHLTYVDDLLVFYKARVGSFTTIKKVFELFKMNNGSKVSERKSFTFFLGAARNILEILQTLLYIVGSFSITYLGLPLSPTIMKLVPMIELIYIKIIFGSRRKYQSPPIVEEE